MVLNWIGINLVGQGEEEFENYTVSDDNHV
jgi:hypothetical protein